MFISLRFEDLINDPDNTFMYQLTYLLEDTTATTRLCVPIEKTIYNNRGEASIIPSGLIDTYRKWNQNVPKNLALFYNSTLVNVPIKEKHRLVAKDMLWTDLYFPYVEYRKYYRCVLNQLSVVSFAGKRHNA